jgi:DNA repair exonuclease SbcCD ATPase subunit
MNTKSALVDKVNLLQKSIESVVAGLPDVNKIVSTKTDFFALLEESNFPLDAAATETFKENLKTLKANFLSYREQESKLKEAMKKLKKEKKDAIETILAESNTLITDVTTFISTLTDVENIAAINEAMEAVNTYVAVAVAPLMIAHFNQVKKLFEHIKKAKNNTNKVAIMSMMNVVVVLARERGVKDLSVKEITAIHEEYEKDQQEVEKILFPRNLTGLYAILGVVAAMVVVGAGFYYKRKN